MVLHEIFGYFLLLFENAIYYLSFSTSFEPTNVSFFFFLFIRVVPSLLIFVLLFVVFFLRFDLVSLSLSGSVSTGGNRVFNGPHGRSLRSFARTTYSAHLLHSNLPCYACFAHSVHGLAHSLRTLLRGTVEIHENVFKLKTRLTGINAIVVITRNTLSV